MRYQSTPSPTPGAGKPGRVIQTGDAQVIFIVDRSEHNRQVLERVLSGRYVTHSFSTVSDFFDHHDPEVHGCILLELNVPGTSSVAVLQRIRATAVSLPVIFLTDEASISSSVHVLRAGAINVLKRPVRPDRLLAAVEEAVRLEGALHEFGRMERVAKKRLLLLTPREREVLNSLMSGRLNKQIASDLGIVENTVKAHRARIMEKLAVRSLAELVLLASSAEAQGVPADFVGFDNETGE